MAEENAGEIIRRPVADQVRAAIWRDVMEGGLPAGSRLNETDLGRRLGVSQTPVREALNNLASEEILDYRPRRGWFVRGLSWREASELYSLLGEMEAFALRLARPDAETLAQARRVNRTLAGARTPLEVVELDAAFHERLLSLCPNATLLALLRRLRHRICRYEVAYMTDAGRVSKSGRQHRLILDLLARGATQEAARALRENWTGDLGSIAEWARGLPEVEYP